MVGLILTAVAAAPEGAESAGIAALGLDWRALLFQLLNFGLLLWLLRRFAYPRIVAVLEARREAIAEGLQTAQQLEVAKAELAQERTRAIQLARQEGEKLVAASRGQAESIIAAAEADAKQRADQVVVEAERKLMAEAATVRSTLAREAVALVTTACERVLGEKLDSATDQALTERAVRQAHKQLRS